jgi:hypothetical protein
MLCSQTIWALVRDLEGNRPSVLIDGMFTVGVQCFKIIGVSPDRK